MSMRNRKHVIYNVLLVFCVAVFIVSGAAIGLKLVVGQKEDRQIEFLKTAFQESLGDVENDREAGGTNKPNQENTLQEQLAERETRLDGYAALQNQNQDMIGWITVPGTEVDYPVMQSQGRPNYYLKHNFKKEKSSYGVPYLSEACDPGGGECNLIIYGHHMKNGTMFAGLMKYTDESFYREHPFIWFDTPESAGVYQIVAVTKAPASSDDETMFRLAGDPTQRQAFLEEVKKRAFYDTGQSMDSGEPLLILITCEYTQTEGRLLVVAEKIKV